MDNIINRIGTDNFSVKKIDNIDVFLNCEQADCGFYLKFTEIDELICLLIKAKIEFKSV
ncbi:hypothetical protein [Clostridium beijerinckii]|uniref:hypothetical protein n=1 Tax=Clostridium beijerinckii TaxID=1520 RepID=UPI00156DB305|nr:hypothetical protein [Clostridium beijerinckii]NRU52375.1 hypothetical protein [Clostridium beijerinckii]NRU52674.1 hypothetical protein [Clostridium beijerinckii]NYC68717.1 hypothetical protein [Clostridium beijerinckii]NYC91866.1 hypothetical protein [Clostridium beijerinckii]